MRERRVVSRVTYLMRGAAVELVQVVSQAVTVWTHLHHQLCTHWWPHTVRQSLSGHIFTISSVHTDDHTQSGSHCLDTSSPSALYTLTTTHSQMLQNATQLNATSNVFLNHMLRRYSTITLYICTVSDDHEMWQFADIISNTQFAGTFGNSSDAVTGCVAVLCSTSTCMSEECQHAHHSRRSVTSDMWCHRKTLTYLHTYLLTVRVTCSDMDDTILIEQMAWQDYNWTD